MSWSTYNEVIAEAREVFGLDLDEARDWYRGMREDFERPVTVEDIEAYPETALGFAEEYFPELAEAPQWAWDEGVADEYAEYVEVYGEEPPYEYFDYELDRYFEDDDWLDPGEEIEVTEDLEYEEG